MDAKTNAKSSRYHEVYARWQRDPEGFWAEAAQEIDWIEKPKTVFDRNAGVYGRWFPDGVCNTCYNAVDRHVEAGRGDAARHHLQLAGHQHQADHHLRRTADQDRNARRHPAPQLRRRQRRPRHPLHADGAGGGGGDARLRAHRRSAFGGVRRLCAERARHPHRRRQAQGDPVGELRHRSRPRHPLQAAARRGDRALQAQARRLSHSPAAAGQGRTDRRPRPRLADDLGRGAGLGEERARTRAGEGDRSALHPLHLGHHRAAQGRGARQRRPHGRAEMVDEESLRRRAGRMLLGGLRHRLGGRPQLHRLCAALARLHHHPLRGQAGRHARRRRVLARDRRARLRRHVHRADRVPRHQEGGPAGQAVRAIRLVEIPNAVPRRRTRRPRHHRLGGKSPESSGDRPLVADRDRLGDRRQSGRPWPIAGQARLADGGDAGLRHPHRRRGVQRTCRAARWARSW